MKGINNLEINTKENCVCVSVNPKIYSLDVIYSAAYVFIDKAYVLIDGDPKKKVIVQITPKTKYDLKKLGGEFNNELLNYANYKSMVDKNGEVRKVFIQRALLTNDYIDSDEEQKKEEAEDTNLDDLDDDLDFLDDPEGIAIPWEEKYGKDAKKSKKNKSKKKGKKKK